MRASKNMTLKRAQTVLRGLKDVEWIVHIHGKVRTREPQRAAARSELSRLRDDEGRSPKTKQARDLRAVANQYRVSVGYVELGAFFCIEGQGDTIADAVEDAIQRRARRYGKEGAQ